MSLWKHALGGVATFGLVASLHPDVSAAASLAVPRVMGSTFGGQIHRAFFHGHSGRGISYYCYPRDYWVVLSIAPTRLRMKALPAACRTSITRRKPIGAVGQ
jgi:hypothetical protein